MRKLGKISLQNLGQAEMTKRELNTLKGGECICICYCDITCGCRYEGGQTGPDDSFYGGSDRFTSDTESDKKLLGNMSYSIIHESNQI